MEIAELETKLKALSKEPRPYSDPELLALKFKLRDLLSKQLLQFATSQPQQVLAGCDKLWKLCFHRTIDEFRKLLSKEPRGKQTLLDYRKFLHESGQFYQSLLEKLPLAAGGKPKAKLLLCLGDLARYREMASEFEEKRWDACFDFYLEAASQWPENGNAQNQLAVVSALQHRYFVASYRYQYALACSIPFDGAKGNLHQLLLKSQDNLPLGVGPVPMGITNDALGQFLNQTLRLQALLLLPSAQEPAARAQFDLIQTQLEHEQFRFRKDVAVALLLSFAFVMDNLSLFTTLTFQTKGKANLAMESFRLFARELVHRCGVEASKPQVPIGSLAKPLLYVCLVMDLCERKREDELIMNDSIKNEFDGLDLALSNLGLLNGEEEEEEENNLMDEEMQEFTSFLFPTRQSSLTTSIKVVSQDENVVKFRAQRVGRFVRNLLELDLKPLAIKQQVFSVYRAGEEDDDEEEEIVFVPSFKYKTTPVGLSPPPPPPGYQQQVHSAYPATSRFAFAVPPQKPQISRPPGFH